MQKQPISKKLSKRDGFTLIEMLIVVAIIAILIAISLPMINNALNKAKMATDAANERSAKAAVILASLSGKNADGSAYNKGTIYAYDAANGVLTTSKPTEYGKFDNTYSQGGNPANSYLIVQEGTDGKLTFKWVQGAIPGTISGGSEDSGPVTKVLTVSSSG